MYIFIFWNWSDLIWFDLIWSDLIWFDLIWLDLTWFHSIWLDLIWFNLRNLKMMVNVLSKNVCVKSRLFSTWHFLVLGLSKRDLTILCSSKNWWRYQQIWSNPCRVWFDLIWSDLVVLLCRDDRFILKQMSRFEFQSFTEFAPHYFKYIKQCKGEKIPL